MFSFQWREQLRELREDINVGVMCPIKQGGGVYYTEHFPIQGRYRYIKRSRPRVYCLQLLTKNSGKQIVKSLHFLTTSWQEGEAGSSLQYVLMCKVTESRGMTCVKEALSNHSPVRKKRVTGAEVKPKERGRAWHQQAKTAAPYSPMERQQEEPDGARERGEDWRVCKCGAGESGVQDIWGSVEAKRREGGIGKW